MSRSAPTTASAAPRTTSPTGTSCSWLAWHRLEQSAINSSSPKNMAMRMPIRASARPRRMRTNGFIYVATGLSLRRLDVNDETGGVAQFQGPDAGCPRQTGAPTQDRLELAELLDLLDDGQVRRQIAAA